MTSLMVTFMSSGANSTLNSSTSPCFPGCGSASFITPGLTVAICGSVNLHNEFVCHYVTTECRSCHLQSLVIHSQLLSDCICISCGSCMQELEVFFHIDIQVCAVSCQSSVDSCCYSRCQVSTDGGCSEQYDVRVIFLDQSCQCLCVRFLSRTQPASHLRSRLPCQRLLRSFPVLYLLIPISPAELRLLFHRWLQ